ALRHLDGGLQFSDLAGARRRQHVGGAPAVERGRMTETPKPPARRRLTGEDSLPGDPSREELVARMIRVDHAGEVGAVRIYRGQLAVLGGTQAGAVIERM